MQAAAEELARLECLPFAAFVTDPCDGRTQGTTGMMDSLAYRNDAAIVFRRLIRSLPTRRGVLGIATCDKGLPAMMMALVGHARPALRARARRRDLAAARRRGRRQGPVDRRALRPRRAHPGARAGAGLPRLRHRRAAAASSWARRPPRRWSPRPSACRCRTRRWRLRDSRSGSTWRAARPAPWSNLESRADSRPRDRDRRRRSQRDDRARRLRRLDESAPARPGHRPRRGPPPPHRRGLERRQPPRAAPRRRPPQRARIPRCASFWPAACPK